MGLIVALIGIVTAFNLLILLAKIKARRWGDFSVDILSLIVLSAVFGHTILGMLIAMVASFIISIYLLVFGI